jgi:hypothetical protein
MRDAFAQNLRKKPRTGRTRLSMVRVMVGTKAARKPPGERDRVMLFLLRATFWLGLVLVLLPSGGTKSETQLSAADAASAATAAVSDMKQFCTRQPTACEIGGKAAVAIGERAQAGAKMLFEFFNERTGASDTATTGSVETAPASQNTLQPTDTAPSWRGPRKDPRHPA